MFAGTLTAVLLGAGLAGAGALSAGAVSTIPGSTLYTDQTFYAYVGAGETLDLSFSQIAPSGAPVTIDVLTPDGVSALSCTTPPGAGNGVKCAQTGLSSATAGVWRIDIDIVAGNARYLYNIVVRDTSSTEVTGRIWTTLFSQYQSSTSTQSYWIATREGYVYGVQFINYNALGSALRANGFGLVEADTCTPIYRSAEGTSIGANGVFLDPSVEYGTECGDDYLLFFEAPDADLPASAPSADGPLWIRPAVVPASATGLQLVQDDPFGRAGDIVFDLAGVNGGYTVQIDTNADGDYTDAADRVIPWGSPPGTVTVPFDGFDGLGEPLSVCQPMNARVVVDRAGETHFVLEDVEALGNGAATQAGIRLTGSTPGVVAPPPRLYWDDRALAARQNGEPFGGVDGRAGIDTTTIPSGNGAHGWRVNWGDTRSIENWTYYQANAGAEVQIPAACSPGLTIDKQAELNDTNDNGRADVGESIDYSFLVSNTGNTPLSGVSVVDPHVTGLTPATVNLAIGDAQLFTAAPYPVTQADVDAGSVQNSAVARGTDPRGEQVESPPDTTIVLGPDRDPSLTIDKSAALGDESVDDGLAQVGETIDYSFLVTNTGNVTLTGVTVDDSRITGVTPAPVTLAPGQSQLFTADPYPVTQDDINTGSITNTAFATGTAPTGPVQSPPDTTITPTPEPDPVLTLDKSGMLVTDADGDGEITPGDTVRYTFSVANTGNVDLVGVTIDDPRLTGPTTPASASIAVGADPALFTADYVVQQGDLDAGVLRNTAVAVGTYVTGDDDEVTVTSAPDTVVLPTAERAPALEVEKTAALADANDNGFADLGETIAYSFLVTNTGNTTITNAHIVDERVNGLDPLPVPLSPGDSGTIVSDPYVVTQADVDAGGVANSAVARGNIPGGPEVTSPPDEEFVDGPPPVPGIELVKSAVLDDANGNGTADAGETIVYSFTLLNSGNVTLLDVAITDEMLGDLVPEPLDLLAPGVETVVSADEYTVTAEDVAAGEIVNVASATGTLNDGATVVESDEDEATVPATQPVAVDPDPDADLARTGTGFGGALAFGVLALLAGLGVFAASRLRRAGP